MNTLQY